MLLWIYLVEPGAARIHAPTFERCALALRTPAGVPESAFDDLSGLEQFIERDGGRVTLTVAGRMVANEITMRLRTDPAEDLEPAGILPR